MVRCWALTTFNEHHPHYGPKPKRGNEEADKFQKGQTKQVL